MNRRAAPLDQAQRAKGFTLIELLLVVSLASLLVTTAVTSLRGLRTRVDLATAARQVALDLNLARARAVAQNRDQRLQFSVGSSQYEVQRIEAGRPQPVGPPVLLPAGVIIKSCNGRDAALQFRPRGNASNFGTVTIENQGLTRSVIVNIAGHVRLG